MGRFFKEQYYPSSEIGLTTFCLFHTWQRAAKQQAAGAIKNSSQLYPELYHNTGSVFFQSQDKDRALYWLRKFLETHKDERTQAAVQFLLNMK